jgi:2-oxoglutarate ferredoxin oxidoreductase subunit alpha
MSVLELESRPRQPSDAHAVVNDFSLVVATANGTGSQTANLTLLRAMFKMGIPVNGKNIFPSNIQGLPTWYHIRVSRQGYVARRQQAEVLIAFNQATVAEDIEALPPGGVCLYNGDWKRVPERDDVSYYPVPVGTFLQESAVKGKLKEYLANMAYVGAAAQLFGIPLEAVEEALSFHFGRRQKLVDSNMAVVRAAHAWSAENLDKRDPYRVEAMDATEGLVMLTGNEAAALGAVFGGVSVAAWYPITPSTSMIDALREYLPKFRRDPETGKATYAVIQAEDELAAAGIVIGAGFAGARALTATSGPGLSLMAEFVGLGYFAEVPMVIWDVQRVGPSTGLPTRTSQGDVTFAYYLGHGDTKNVLLFPGTVAECFEFGYRAFDLAEELQTPVLVLSDLDLGMNNWMSEPFAYPAEPLKRGKVLSAEEIEAKGFARYRDVDGDGVPYRTLPGTNHPLAAYFARGTGHNEEALYSERSEDWEKNMARLARKFDTARRYVPAPILDEVEGAEVGLIAFGSTLHAIDEARDALVERELKTSFLRLRALPITREVEAFIARHERVYVVELNRDGQLCHILRSELPELAPRLQSLTYYDAMPLTPQQVLHDLGEREGVLS